MAWLGAQFAVLTAVLFSEPVCHRHGIKDDFNGLERSLDNRLHGQHLVKSVVLQQLIHHFHNDNPQKALVFSFHGPPGVGKSFVGDIVAEHLYLDGMKSKYVHRKTGQDFTHASRLDDYKDEMREWVERGVKDCPRAMFIIEEVHQIPGVVIDVLSSYLDNYAIKEDRHNVRVDYRKAIFFLISNIGDKEINQHVLDNWEKGNRREDITHKEMNTLLLKTAFNEAGGLWRSKLIKRGMISAFVGFLPLEKKHVWLCARDEAQRKRIRLTDDQLDSVVEEMIYTPSDRKIFSAYGCRPVTDAVDQVRHR